MGELHNTKSLYGTQRSRAALHCMKVGDARLDGASS